MIPENRICDCVAPREVKLNKTLATIFTAAIFICISAVLASVTVAASDYPSRPVRMIVGFSPGGGADTMARVIGERLGNLWGQQVVIDNRGGAGGTVGTILASRAAPDGYTLMLAAANHPINPSLYPNLSYDPVQSFEPIGLVGSAPMVLVVNPAVNARDVKALMALARARPGKLNFGSPGNGSTPHLAAELFKSLAHINMVHVPYKGNSQALVDLLGGQIDMTFSSTLPVVQHVRSGKLHALAVTGAARSSLFPTVPTMEEAGVTGYDVIQWWGVIAPAGLSRVIIDKIEQDLDVITRQEDVRKRLISLGVEPNFIGASDFKKRISSELVTWTRVVKAAKIQLE
jgi:tripartite-type tricarboxylate transporter receptor subunit TctC